MNRFFPLVSLFFFLASVSATAQIDYKGFPEWSLQKRDSTEYALYTPQHLMPGKKYPVVLFMHGCCGTDNHATLRNAVDPPVRMWHQFGANKQIIPTYIIAPATSRGWKQHFSALKAVIDDLIANHQADPQRVYVTGFSMGGEGTFRIIQEYPGFFAAAIPMGMSFFGDSLKVKDVPIWANQGETDYYSRSLRKQVAAIRKLNAAIEDTGSTWLTGVYPRYSNFKGVGHGVQWIAASTQDLTGWAYSKINDGNKEPVVFIDPVLNPITASRSTPVQLTIHATDPDGSIDKVTIKVNRVLYKTLRVAPYQFAITASPGDNVIEATAYDKKGKYTTAATIVRAKTSLSFIPAVLPAAYAGSAYTTQVIAKGNGTIVYTAVDKNQLPKGVNLFADGSVKGLPQNKGLYRIDIAAMDEENQTAHQVFTIEVKAKKANDVLVSGASTDSTSYQLAKMAIGEAPFFNSRDTVLTISRDEINFSEIGSYAGLTYIRTNENDAKNANEKLLHFTIDEKAIVYIAYEKLDGSQASTIPAWLNSFKKEKEQVVAQYRYFDVYSKIYDKGAVVIPGADAGHNGVSSNYFVMIKKL